MSDRETMRDSKGRPLPWLRDIYAHRDRIEKVVRGIHGGPENCGYMTSQLMALQPGDSILDRAHRHLVSHYAPRFMWSDPQI